MSKGIKIILSIVSTLVLVSIILPIFISVLLNFGVVQNYVVDKATVLISNKIGSDVSIGAIKLDLFRRVKVSDFYVSDLNGDTLLMAGKVSGALASKGLLHSNFDLADVEIANAKMYLIQGSDSLLNLRHVLDKLKNKDKTEKSDFKLYSHSINLENVDFVIRRYNPQHREHGINFQDLNLRGINLDGSNFSIVGDSISFKLNSASFVEQSGFELDNFSGDKVAVSNGNIFLENVNLKSGLSNINLVSLTLRSSEWPDFADFIAKVKLNGQIKNSNLSSNVLAYFAPSLSDWDLEVDNVNMNFAGTINNLLANVSNISLDQTDIKGSLSVKGLPDITRTSFDFKIKDISTNSSSIDYIASHIGGKPLSPSLLSKLEKMQDISFEGRFNGLFSDFAAGGKLSSAMGDVDLDMNLRPLAEGNTGFEGHLSTLDFRLGSFLSSAAMGDIAVQTSVNGSYGSRGVYARTSAVINEFMFNGYEYQDIRLDGQFENKNFIGQVRSPSEDIRFEFDGMLDFNDSIPRYNFDLRLDEVDLAKINVNRRDSISTLSCRITAKAQGTNLDDLDGNISIRDLLYINQVDSVRTGNILFTAKNEQTSKHINMASDFADAEFMGSSSYSDMFVYLDRALHNYLPSLSSSLTTKRTTVSGPAQSGEYYVVKVDVKEANNVTGIFVPGLHVAKGTSAVFMLNPTRDVLSLKFSSDYIERGNMFVSNLSVNSHNESDSISVFVRADDFFAAGVYLPDLSIIGGARNNTVSLDTRVGSQGAATRAFINTTTFFTKDSTGLDQIVFRFDPSTITVNDQEWFLQAQDIVYDTTGVRVGGFNIRGLGQSLAIEGYASRSTQDTLKLSLNNFDIAPLSKLVESKGYSISGRTNGYLNAVSALSTDVIMAEINFDSIVVNNVEVPDTKFTSQWDAREKRASIFVDRTDNNKRVIRGYYSPMDKRYYITTDIARINLSLLDPVLSGVIGSTEGSAEAKLQIKGSSGNLHDIDGSIVVDSLKTKVLFTNVDYNIGRTVLDVKDNVLSVRGAKMTDGTSGYGDLNLNFDATNFKNLKYELMVNANELLALNTTAADNELFYGRVFASGMVSIKGDNLGSAMLVSASTAGSSELYMPLSGSESASEADFIVFRQPRNDEDSSSYSIRKRQIMRDGSVLAARSGGNFDMNMQLNVQPNLEFQLVIDPTVGDIIRGRGQGTINMRVNPRSDQFTMYGDYTISDGSYLFTLRNIINKKFVIEPGGTIQWTGDPVDALLDITAVYKLKTSLAPLLNSNEYNRRVSVDCAIQLGDRLSQPLITFDVQVPNADTETQSLVSNALNTQEMKATQFLWLLAVNSFYSDNSNSESSVNIGATGTAVTGIEFLSNQLSNWLSSERFSLVPRYIPRSETTDDEFGLEFSAELIKNKLVIEGEGSYGGEYGVSSVSNNSTNFSNDLTAYWLFDQEGSIKAKAFTRTIDTFDENQGLQESGIGIFYRENFNNLRELLSNLRNRFVRKDDYDEEDELDD